MNFKDLSDFELNLMAARLLLDYDRIEDKPHNDKQIGVNWGDGYNWYSFDPCNDWNDIGPVIEEYKINLKYLDPRWQAWAMGSEPTSKEYRCVNPKRAAVIVFLKIKGVV